MKNYCASALAVVFAFGLAFWPNISNAIAGQDDTRFIYVSVKNGSDAWSGRSPAPNAEATDGPLASFEAARDLVRSIDKTNVRKIVVMFRDGSQPDMTARLSPVDPRPARISPTAFRVGPSGLKSLIEPVDDRQRPKNIRDGVYRLSSKVILGAGDSGSPFTDIVYQNYPGEHPVFSGGVPVKNWTNISGNKWVTTLPATTQPFENLYYNGERRLRPRLGGYLGPYNRIASTTVVDPKDTATWTPNDCSAYQNTNLDPECFDRFTYETTAHLGGDPSDPRILDPSSWGNLYPNGDGRCGQNANDISSQAGDIEALVFEQFSSSKLRVSCVDQNKRIVYMTGPTAVPGANNAQEAGFITGNRIILENVKGALSEPGQWFLDHPKNQPWTLTYLARDGENPNKAEIIIPQADQLVVGVDLHHVTFRGLTFEHDNYVLPPPGHASGELEHDITSALSFQNSSEILIDGIVVRHTAGGGLDFITCILITSSNASSPSWCQKLEKDPVSARSAVVNSVFYDLGVHGVRIGENATNGLESIFNDANSPHDYFVSNNLVAGFGRVIPAAFGIGQGVGHDNIYTKNEVYDGYHTAISISHGGIDTAPTIGMGNANNIIAFNRVYNLFQGIMNDGGALRIESGNQTGTSPNNRIANNVVHDVSDASIIDNSSISYLKRPGYGGVGIYLDNSTGAVVVENNLVYRVSDIAVYTPHGPALPGYANIVRNNILAYARKAMIGVNDPYYVQNSQPNEVSYNPTESFEVSNNLFYFDRSGALDPSFTIEGNCTFPGDTFGHPPTLRPFTGFERFSSNLYWNPLLKGGFQTYAGGFQVQTVTADGLKTNIDPCGVGANKIVQNLTPDFNQWQQTYGEDQGSQVKDPNFVKPYYPFDDFTLKYGSPGVGFVPFDPHWAGREFDGARPQQIPPGFLTYSFNPVSDF